MPGITAWYHDDLDGYGCLWALHSCGVTVEDATEVSYHSDVPAPPPDSKDRDLFILDFSFPEPVMDELAKQWRSITIIDHHVTASWLPGWSRKYEGATVDILVKWNPEHAACILTWQSFSGSMQALPPFLLQIIEDWDMWWFKMPQTKALYYWLLSMRKDLKLWDMVAKKWRAGNWKAEENVGVGIMDFLVVQAKTIAEGSYFQEWYDKGTKSNIKVQIVNASSFLVHFVSEELLELAPVAAMYHDVEDKRIWSLRSKKDGPLVSILALDRGGGGHPHAAGFVETI